MMELPIPDSTGARKRWYALGLGAATVFFVFAVATACMPVLFNEIAEKLDLSIVQIGTVWGASSVAAIVSILLAGMAADRFGTKRTIFVGCLIAGVFGALRGISDSFLTLVITSLLFGFASEAVPVVVVKNTSQWFHGRGLATAQGIITAGVGGGMMLSAMLSATVLSPLLGGWNNVVLLYGGISILVGFAWLLTIHEPERTVVSDSDSRPTPRSSLSHLLRIRGVWLVAIGMLGFAGCNKGVNGYLPLYLKNNDWTDTAADGALAALNAAGTAASIPLTLLSDRLGLRKTVLVPGVIITTICTGLLSILTGQAAWVLVIMIGAVRDMIWAMAATMIVETKGVGLMYAGTAVGIVHMCTRIGYTIAPPIGNSLEEIQSGLSFVFWAGLSLIAVLAFLMVKETGRGR
jgi:MFS family permease